MKLNLDPNWRRAVLALVFGGSGMALQIMAVWLAWNVLNAPWPASLAGQRLSIIGMSLYATLGLMGLVLTGLAMTVSLRQVSGKFLGGEFEASGNADGGAGDKLQDAGAALIDAGASVKGQTP